MGEGGVAGVGEKGFNILINIYNKKTTIEKKKNKEKTNQTQPNLTRLSVCVVMIFIFFQAFCLLLLIHLLTKIEFLIRY